MLGDGAAALFPGHAQLNQSVRMSSEAVIIGYMAAELPACSCAEISLVAINFEQRMRQHKYEPVNNERHWLLAAASKGATIADKGQCGS